jgi:hypothetical protein
MNGLHLGVRSSSRNPAAPSAMTGVARRDSENVAGATCAPEGSGISPFDPKQTFAPEILSRLRHT